MGGDGAGTGEGDAELKPRADDFCIVTCTTNWDRSKACRESWEARATYRFPVYVVKNGGELPYLGTVPAFAEGIKRAGSTPIIACLHDDLLIEEDGWDARVLKAFREHPDCGLAGFLGGTGLGDANVYQKPYSPHQLARQDVWSNERNAEAHGQRTRHAKRVAVLDGFSQIGRAEYWRGYDVPRPGHIITGVDAMQGWNNLYTQMASWGITHHAYDAARGGCAARLGWEVWMLPVKCWHQGGQTAVGDPGYAEWAKGIVPGGDQDFWEIAHKEVYDRFRDVLPLRVK